jgi:hypothetical protein
LIKGERRVIEAHRSIRTRPVLTLMFEGDRAVINWVFDFVDHEGRAYTQDELAFQFWRGERIIEECFYYDPAQRTRSPRRPEPPRNGVECDNWAGIRPVRP